MACITTHIDEVTARLNFLPSNPCAERSPPFLRIPTEILEIIFIYGASDYYSRDNGRLTLTLPSWVNVSYVCRHWRSVALDCTLLWSYIFVASPRWTELLLARSKQAPLKLYVDPISQDITSPDRRFVQQVMVHIERIQELRLNLPFTKSIHQVFSKLSSRAPLLRRLKLSAVSTGWSSVLFDGDTPALCSLELTNCPVPWYLFKLSCLTTLSLCGIPLQFRQNMVDFLATLGNMQDLTNLYLDNALLSAAGFLSSATFRTFQKINLPSLSCLLIIAPVSTTTALLACINIPLKTQLKLRLQPECGFSQDDYISVTSLLARRLGTLDDETMSRPTIRSAVIQYKEWHEVVLSFSPSERNYDRCASSEGRICSHSDCNMLLHISVLPYFWGPETLDDKPRIISKMYCSMPLTNVQSLHITNPPFSSEFWSRTLCHLADLRYLKLSRGYMPDLASALSSIPHHDAENQGGYTNRETDPPVVLVPALAELELDSIAFSTQTLDGREPYIANVQPLFDALSSRKESRGQLTMTRCRVFECDSVRMLNMVGCWEGGHFHVKERHYQSEAWASS